MIRDKETGETEILQTVLTLDLDSDIGVETHCTKCTNAVNIFKTRKNKFKIPKIYLNVHGKITTPNLGPIGTVKVMNETRQRGGKKRIKVSY